MFWFYRRIVKCSLVTKYTTFLLCVNLVKRNLPSQVDVFNHEQNTEEQKETFSRGKCTDRNEFFKTSGDNLATSTNKKTNCWHTILSGLLRVTTVTRVN